MKQLTRKDFLKLAAMESVAAMIVPGLGFGKTMHSEAESMDDLVTKPAQKLDIKIGSTFIHWGYSPNDLEPALGDITDLGFHAFETFGWVIQEWEEHRGGFDVVVKRHGVPIISAFCMADVIDPSKRKQELHKLLTWAKYLKKSGGKLVEFATASINRIGYDYKKHKKDIIDSLNEYAKAVTDMGLVFALHPHTGTAIETQEEVYFAMENVNTDYMKFGPDVGQLQKGGADPVKIVRDFLPLVQHVHLKDFEGGNDNGWNGYAPLGKGNVKIREILEILKPRRGKMTGMIMWELDPDKMISPALSTYVAAEISRDYLMKLGYQFKM